MLEQEVNIPNASAKQVYDILMSPELHAELTGGPVEITEKVGSTFSTFGGYASGKNLELIPGKLIKQTWRPQDWPEGHYSTIIFNLSDTPDGAKIEFIQKNLPEGAKAEFEAGWQENYWQPLVQHFEN